MPSKTTDIEQAITAALEYGNLTVDQVRGIGVSLDDDPRWTAVALMHLERAGLIGYPGCPNGHLHEAGCVVEVAR